MRNGWALVGIVWLALVFRGEAQAQAACDPASIGCHIDGVVAEWRYRNAAFEDVMVDTGWQPPGAPIQLRFQLSFGGSTEVDMDGEVVTEWPPPLAVSVPGRAGTGRLAINYGLELAVRLRFDINVAGIRYRWDGDIPVPGIPEDLRAAAEGFFDPYLLPPSVRPFSVMDSTDRVEVLRYDALGGLISLPGVGGGIAITLQGDLDVSYQTITIVVSDASPITMEDAFTVVSPDPGEVAYGPAKDLLVHPEGVLGFSADVIIAPILYLSFVGTRRDFPIVEIPIRIADELVDVIFDDHATHVPLPDIRVSSMSYGLGEVAVGGASERIVVIDNVGEAPLDIILRAPEAPFGVDEMTMTLAPASEGSFTLSFSPEMAGPASGVLLLETNDPDESTVALRLMGTGFGTPTGDAELPTVDGGMVDAGGVPPPDEGGCGCRAARGDSHGATAGWIALIVFVVAWRRRRATALDLR